MDLLFVKVLHFMGPRSVRISVYVMTPFWSKSMTLNQYSKLLILVLSSSHNINPTRYSTYVQIKSSYPILSAMVLQNLLGT